MTLPAICKLFVMHITLALKDPSDFLGPFSFVLDKTHMLPLWTAILPPIWFFDSSFTFCYAGASGRGDL